MSPTTDRRAIALAVVTMLTWASAGSFVRLIAAKLSSAAPFIPLAVLAGRLFASLLILLVILAIFQPKALLQDTLPALRRSETWIAAGFQFVYYLLAVFAFMLAPISEIALCSSTAPLWVLLLRRLQKQTVSKTEFYGAMVSLAGVLVIVLPNLLGAGKGGVNPFPYRILGDSLSLTSALITALYALLQRRYVAEGRAVDGRALSLATFLIGLPLMYFLKPSLPTVLHDGALLGLFGGLAAAATVVPTLAFAAASRRLPPATTATSALLLPVFAAGFAAFALREIPPWTLLPGGMMVLCGLWMILRPAAKPD